MKHIYKNVHFSLAHLLLSLFITFTIKFFYNILWGHQEFCKDEIFTEHKIGFDHNYIKKHRNSLVINKRIIIKFVEILHHLSFIFELDPELEEQPKLYQVPFLCDNGNESRRSQTNCRNY